MADWRAKAKKVDVIDEDRAAFAAPEAPAAPAAPAPEPTEAELEAMKQAELEKRIAKRPMGEGSFATGLKQGATLSFADEIAGAAGALGALAGDATLAEVPDYYRQARDEERKRLEESRQADPLLTGAGQVAGSLLLPGAGAAGAARGGLAPAMAAGAGLGAVTGAASGVGEAKTLAPQDLAAPVMTGAGVGALFGGAAPLVGTVLRPAARAVQAPLARAGERADELRVLTAAGATGGSINAPRVLQEAQRVPGGVPEMARVLRESGISRGVTTTSGVLRRAQQARAASGADIGRLIQEATDAGGTVDAAKLVATLRASADEAVAGMGGVSDVARQQAAALQRLADRIQQAAPTGKATFEEVKSLSQQLGADAGEAYLARAMGRPVTGKAEALMGTRRAAEGAIDAGMEAAGRSSTPYREARRLNQVARIAEETAETSLGRAGKNNLLGLTDAALLAGGGPTAALAAGRKALTPVSAGLRATGAETARSSAEALERLLAQGPTGALGRTGGALTGATVGAMEAPVSVQAGAEASPLEGYTSEEQALARDLLTKGLGIDEVMSILGPPSSMSRPALRTQPSAAR